MSGGDKQRDRLILPVALVVLGGWVTSLVYAVIQDEYAPLTAVTPVMLLLAGYVFGSNIIRSATRDRYSAPPDPRLAWKDKDEPRD